MSSQPTSNCGGHTPWLTRRVPALDWLRHYERKHLPGDALMGAARLGVLTNFLSQPVLSGFTSAAACLIALSQVTPARRAESAIIHGGVLPYREAVSVGANLNVRPGPERGDLHRRKSGGNQTAVKQTPRVNSGTANIPARDGHDRVRQSAGDF